MTPPKVWWSVAWKEGRLLGNFPQAFSHEERKPPRQAEAEAWS
ncbi:hypothetical protein ACN28S_02830 [Cystobacter fuscus]